MSERKEPNGAQRAAAFLLSLDKDAAATVLKHLDEDVVVDVVEAMAGLDPNLIEHDNLRGMYRDLVVALRKPRTARVRSETELRTMLDSVLGKSQAGSVFEKIHQRLLHQRPFMAVEREPARNIAVALAEESDAVIAVVLAHIEPAISAEVLASLEKPRSLEVVRRMAALIPPGFDTLAAIARDLAERLKTIASAPVMADPSVRLKSIAEVLSFSEPQLEESLLQGLEQTDAPMAAGIRELMFTWEDLAGLDKRAMQKLLSSVDTQTLAVALKACSNAVEANIMANLSSRVREMVAEERELAGKLPMKEVLAAREKVMQAVRTLMEGGEFRPARAGDDLVS